MAEAYLVLGTAKLVDLLLAFLELELVEAGAQDLHGGLAVLDLGLFVLAGHDCPGGEVGDADGGVGGVDALAAGSAGAVDVDAEVFLADVDLDVVGEDGHDLDAAEGCLAALLLVCGADAH